MSEDPDLVNRLFLEAVNAPDQLSAKAAEKLQRILRGAGRPVPSSRCWRMSRKHRAALGKISGGVAGYTRTSLHFGVSKMRLLIFPEISGDGDPDLEWKKWGDRVSKGLGSRIPGNWHTRRGRKKRKKWLMRNFGRC